LRPRRARLLSGLEGKILEIGVGTGINFEHYGPAAEVIGIEPSPHMIAHAFKKRERFSATTQITLYQMGWEDEALAAMVAPSSLDHVVCTLVMCTIPRPEEALQRFQYWLRPGGRLILLEHIRARRHYWGRLQDWLTPAWSLVAGGCQLNRPTNKWVESHGFELLSAEQFRLGLPFYEAVYLKHR